MFLLEEDILKKQSKQDILYNKIDEYNRTNPHKIITAIPEVKFTRIPNRLSNILGSTRFNKDKLGGKPDWLIGNKKNPLCGHCHIPMVFYGQLDAIGNNGFPFTRLYAFYCFECNNCKVISQIVDNNKEFHEIDQVPTIRLRRDDSNKAIYFPNSNDDDFGKRSKIGGRPNWIQGNNTPNCADCKNAMTFYGQLDSINEQYAIADAGMLYLFYCFKCNKAKIVMQCY